MDQTAPNNERVFAPTKENVDPRAEKLLASVVISGNLGKLDRFSVEDLKKGRWTSVLLIACLITHQTGPKTDRYLNTICGHALEIMMKQEFYGEEMTAVFKWWLGHAVKIKSLIQNV